MKKKDYIYLSSPAAAGYSISKARYDAREASCVGITTPLRVLDYAGNTRHVPAGEILRNQERYPYLLLESQDGQPAMAPVRAVVKTMAKGFEIELADGRSVSLTGSHVVPGDPNHGEGSQVIAVRQVCLPKYVRDRALRGQTGDWYIVLHDDDDRLGSSAFAEEAALLGMTVEAFRPVTPGDILLDGEVAAVRPLGFIESVRVWTDNPGWMLTESGIRLGHRIHELASAWMRAKLIPLSEEE